MLYNYHVLVDCRVHHAQDKSNRADRDIRLGDFIPRMPTQTNLVWGPQVPGVCTPTSKTRTPESIWVPGATSMLIFGVAITINSILKCLYDYPCRDERGAAGTRNSI